MGHTAIRMKISYIDMKIYRVDMLTFFLRYMRPGISFYDHKLVSKLIASKIVRQPRYLCDFDLLATEGSEGNIYKSDKQTGMKKRLKK